MQLKCKSVSSKIIEEFPSHEEGRGRMKIGLSHYFGCWLLQIITIWTTEPAVNADTNRLKYKLRWKETSCSKHKIGELTFQMQILSLKLKYFQ